MWADSRPAWAKGMGLIDWIKTRIDVFMLSWSVLSRKASRLNPELSVFSCIYYKSLSLLSQVNTLYLRIWSCGILSTNQNRALHHCVAFSSLKVFTLSGFKFACHINVTGNGISYIRWTGEDWMYVLIDIVYQNETNIFDS